MNVGQPGFGRWLTLQALRFSHAAQYAVRRNSGLPRIAADTIPVSAGYSIMRKYY